MAIDTTQTVEKHGDFDHISERAKNEARTSDSCGLVALDGDGNTEAFVMVRELDGDDYTRERLRHEIYMSLTHLVTQRMNPLAIMTGQVEQPEPKGSDAQVPLDAVDTDADDVCAAIDASEAFVFVKVDEEKVEWQRSEGAAYGGGCGINPDGDREALNAEVLEATRTFATR